MNYYFKENIKTYLEPDYELVGLVPNPSNHSTDNGLLFSATYLMLNPEDREYFGRLYSTMIECNIDGYEGLFARYPNDKGMNAHDDQVGICYLSYFHTFTTPLAKAIYNHGRKTYGFWNTENPEKRNLEAFFVRIPSHWAMIKAAAKVPLNLFDVFYSSLAYIGDMFVKKEETNGRCLLLMRSKILEGHSIILDFVMKLWKNRMNRKYTKGVKELYSIYFGENHPLSKYAPEVF